MMSASVPQVPSAAQFQHVTDITPTILEAVGVPAPKVLNGVEQKPMEGSSLVYTFNDPKAPTRHPTQYFEITANRGIYHDGWMASTTPLRLPWVTSGSDPDPLDFAWELYDIRNDFSQAHNLAKENPAKLKELQDLFWKEAEKYNVLPLDASFADRADPASRPSVTGNRKDFTYYPGMIRITEGSTPDIKNKSYTLTADIEIPQGGAEGVIATQGGRFAGWGLLVLDNVPVFAYRVSNQPRHLYLLKSKEALTPGNHVIKLDFKYDGGGIGKGGTGTLYIDGKEVGSGHVDQTVPIRFSLDESFDVGQDTGTPIMEEYSNKMPFKFTGNLKKFHIHLGDSELNENDQKELNTQKSKAASIHD
jgi:arylsulfatase